MTSPTFPRDADAAAAGITPLEGPPPDALLAFLDARVRARGWGHWRWKFAGGEPGSPRGFVHRARDGTVNGFIGLMPEVLHVGGAAVSAAWLVDWVAADEAVGTGVALLRKAVTASPLPLTLSGSAIARDIYTRLRWEQQPIARVWILHLGARYLSRRGPGRRWPLLRPFALVAGALARLHFRVARPASMGIVLEEVDRFGAATDAAFAARQAEFAPLMARTSATLNRRFADYPGGGYLRYVLRRDAEVVGHLVLRDDRIDEWRRGRIVDALWPRTEPGVADWLVREATWRLQKRGVDYVECTASIAEVEAALQACRFRPGQTLPLFYRRPPAEVGEPGGWYVTYYDADRAWR